jgi:hypothetical protein
VVRRPHSAQATTLVILAAITGVFGLAIHHNLRTYGGNWTGFVVFGSHFAAQTHPPAGSVVLTGEGRNGYDGQFYYVLARDPLLRHPATLSDLAGQTFRAERIGYPALARVASEITGVTLPFALVAVNVALVLLLVAVFTWYAPRRGWSRWWALVLGLFPGFLLATLRDLTDPLATIAGVLALLAWTRGRRWLACGLLTVAVLSREVMVLAVAAVFIDAVLRAWRGRAEPLAVRRLVAELVPGVMIPAGAFAGWQAYIAFRNGGIARQAGTMFPFTTFARDIHDALQSPLASFAQWDLAYEAIIIIGVAVALTTVWRRPNLFSIGAALFALGLSVGAFEPVWSDTRDSLPLLALLLIGGLQDRRRLNLAVCLGAAATTAAIPLAIPGIFSG